MSNITKRFTAIGVAAAAIGFVTLAAQTMPSFASDAGEHLFAQANDPNGKPNNDAGTPNRQVPSNRPSNPAPTTQPPASSQPNEPAAVILKNSTQSGVPARCASVTNTAERQKCMDTPKGQ